MKPTLVALLVAAVTLPAATAAQAPLRVKLVSGPPVHPVAGEPWRLALRVQRGTRPYTGRPPVVTGRGDAGLTVRLRRTARRGVFAAAVSFPTSGPWILEAAVAGRRFALGVFAVDVPVNQLVREPFAIAALADGSLVIGQRQGPLLRWRAGQLTAFADVQPVHNLSLTPRGIVLAAENGRLHRLTTAGAAAEPPLVFDADPVAAGDAAGNTYVSFYENRVVRVDASGTATPFAGTGEEGFGGDGGPATQAKLFHPHDVAVGADGMVYIADTENSRIRRVDPATGTITSFGGNTGYPVSLDVGPDGAVYSAGVARGSTPAGIWRTTAAGSTLVAQGADVNSVAVAPDGVVYLVQWQQWRIARIDPRSGLIRTILRGR